MKNEALTLPDRKSVFGFTYLPEKKMFVFSIVSVVSIYRYIIYKKILPNDSDEHLYRLYTYHIP